MKFTVDYREPEDNRVEVYTTPGYTTIVFGDNNLELLITDKTAAQIVAALKEEME